MLWIHSLPLPGTQSKPPDCLCLTVLQWHNVDNTGQLKKSLLKLRSRRSNLPNDWIRAGIHYLAMITDLNLRFHILYLFHYLSHLCLSITILFFHLFPLFAILAFLLSLIDHFSLIKKKYIQSLKMGRRIFAIYHSNYFLFHNKSSQMISIHLLELFPHRIHPLSHKNVVFTFTKSWKL